MKIDYSYLCNGLGHLTGLDAKVFKDNKIIERYSSYDYDPDIVNLILPEINEKDDNAFYIETEELLVFGVIKSKRDKTTIILGPTSQIRPTRQDSINILARLNQPLDKLQDIIGYFNSLIPYPLENFLEIICFVNYAVNEDKLSAANLIYKSDLNTIKTTSKSNENKSDGSSDRHNTNQTEQQILAYIQTGNVEGVHKFISQPTAGRTGSIAHSELRQRKNMFICAATLFSRAAIKGGLGQELAFVISDQYIRKVELLNNASDIVILNTEMILDYTKRVESIRCGNENSQLARNVLRYIYDNISTKFSIGDIAQHLNLNRTYLCERFKRETGNTINNFILDAKIEKAKELMETTNLSIADISYYLAFSSQSYFQSVFKKLV
jgi:AraC-like DNA-binding protein